MLASWKLGNISSFAPPVSPVPHQRDSTQSPASPVVPLQNGRTMGRRCPPAVTVPSGRWLPGGRWFCSRQGGAWWGRQPWQGQRIAVPTRWLPHGRGARLPTRRTRWPSLSLSARSGRRRHDSTAFAVLCWFLAPDHGGVVIELRLDTRFRGWPRRAVMVRQNFFFNLLKAAESSGCRV